MRFVSIPTIETARITLEPPREEDFDGYAEIVTGERGRYVGGPLPLDEAWLDFSQMVAGWIFRGYGALTARDKRDGTYLGTVLVHHERGDPEPELGWLFAAKAEGHGYAFEAAAAMRDWAFQHTPLPTLVSYVDPNNVRARRLAERLGGTLAEGPEGMLTYRYAPLSPS